MNTWVVVTIITALASLGGAVLAWVQASRTAKLNAKAQVELENLKGENSRALEKLKAELTNNLEKRKVESEKRLKAYEMAVADVTETEAGLIQGWQLMQQTKDMLSGVKGSHPDRERVVILSNQLQQVSADLIRAYNEVGFKIPDDARVLLHRAKNDVYHLHSQLSELNHQDEKARSASWATFENSSQDIHEFLSSVQANFIQTREHLRRERMERILAAWNGEADANKGQPLPTPPKS